MHSVALYTLLFALARQALIVLSRRELFFSHARPTGRDTHDPRSHVQWYGSS